MCKRCGATVTKRMKLLNKPCREPGKAGMRNKRAYKEGAKLPGYPSWPYKKSNTPFATSLFAESGSDRPILENIQKQLTTMRARQESLPVGRPESDAEDSGPGSDVESICNDVCKSSGSESD